MTKLWNYFKQHQAEFLFLTILATVATILKQNTYLEFFGISLFHVFVGLWLTAVLILKFPPKISVIFGILSLFLAAVFTAFKIENIALRICNYGFVFIIEGIFRSWIQSPKD
jgi:hypothetical protein